MHTRDAMLLHFVSIVQISNNIFMSGVQLWSIILIGRTTNSIDSAPLFTARAGNINVPAVGALFSHTPENELLKIGNNVKMWKKSFFTFITIQHMMEYHLHNNFHKVCENMYLTVYSIDIYSADVSQTNAIKMHCGINQIIGERFRLTLHPCVALLSSRLKYCHISELASLMTIPSIASGLA